MILQNRWKIFFGKYFCTPYAFQSIEAKLFVATKKDSVQSLHSEKNVKFKKYLKIEPSKQGKYKDFLD